MPHTTAEAVTLSTADRGEHVSVEPRLGGLVSQLVLAGREWLHRNAYVTTDHRQSADFAHHPSYRDVGELGLGDQCLFTVAKDTLALPGGGSWSLQDHGQIWALPPSHVQVSRDPAADTLVTRWRSHEAAHPFELERVLSLQSRQLEARFTLNNSGPAPLPLFWSSFDTVPLDPGTRFELPKGTEMVVHHSRRAEFTAGVHRWPRFTLRDGRPVDLSRPAEARARLGKDFACKVFSKEAAGPLTLVQGTRTLILDAAGTHAGLWINWGGESPPGERYQLARPMRSLGGPTDRVSQGMALPGARWLAPGQQHRWILRYSAG